MELILSKDKVLELARMKKVTQAKLALWSGMSPQNLSDRLNRRTKTPLRMLGNLCLTLECKSDDITEYV